MCRRNDVGSCRLQLRSIAAADQNLALADVVGGADNAFCFHLLNNPSGAVVAYLKMALHETRRSLALSANHRNSLCIELITRFAVLVSPEWVEGCVVVFGN